MNLRERLAENKLAFDAVITVATCRDSIWFGDLCWPPFDSEAERHRLINGSDPGVIFETPTRVVVIHEHSGELRYFAGGWCSHQSRIYLEQDRIWAEGHEVGVFPSPQEAMSFAELYLVREQPIQEICTPRDVRGRQDTDNSGRTSRA